MNRFILPALFSIICLAIQTTHAVFTTSATAESEAAHNTPAWQQHPACSKTFYNNRAQAFMKQINFYNNKYIRAYLRSIIKDCTTALKAKNFTHPLLEQLNNLERYRSALNVKFGKSSLATSPKARLLYYFPHYVNENLTLSMQHILRCFYGNAEQRFDLVTFKLTDGLMIGDRWDSIMSYEHITQDEFAARVNATYTHEDMQLAKLVEAKTFAQAVLQELPIQSRL